MRIGVRSSHFLVVVGCVLLLWVRIPTVEDGQVRKFGTEIAPPQNGPQPCRIAALVERRRAHDGV